ncbi:MAG: hypothetical protein A2091_03785 [Desulfuromonadales bacterium GWD2_61_12]|nr:MAG: hypothetical protein A2005_09100 [Desulfuromonadales bacterium GWC2_61_20]OGR36128.1 MAG: hypothetical protein A2091_03785 [Desulfuromonadales bacterium GWD2_61_12]
MRNRLLVAAIVVLAVGLLGWGLSRNTTAGSPLVKAEQGQITLPLAQVNDGQAHFYRYQSGATSMAFFVVRGSDGRIRVALDTCDACYAAKKGYRQHGEVMICNNCEQQFPTVKINEVSGGCNPVAVPIQLAGDQLTIASADLDRGARYFH